MQGVNIRSRSGDGSTEPRNLVLRERDDYPKAWTADGNTIVFVTCGERLCDVSIVNLEGDEPKWIKISRQTEGAATAGDIDADPAVTVVSTDLALATLTRDTDFEMEMERKASGLFMPGIPSVQLQVFLLRFI